ncbi:hypothetical protein HA050_03315 [Iodobacter sp. HSC-16F04]|uniref:Lipoprotein n=1 Tax=Iodobacter violaceini TaxID=3044271 RepID=A0ABX0KVR0_9NEIS|nr:hypothetical protein [Iodobacter violacea]NHQ85141.1 hypothetical protein [Iodobacter violacea]
MKMKECFFLFFLGSVLSACGGGGSETAATTSSVPAPLTPSGSTSPLPIPQPPSTPQFPIPVADLNFVKAEDVFGASGAYSILTPDQGGMGRRPGNYKQYQNVNGVMNVGFFEYDGNFFRTSTSNIRENLYFPIDGINTIYGSFLLNSGWVSTANSTESIKTGELQNYAIDSEDIYLIHYGEKNIAGKSLLDFYDSSMDKNDIKSTLPASVAWTDKMLNGGFPEGARAYYRVNTALKDVYQVRGYYLANFSSVDKFIEHFQEGKGFYTDHENMKYALTFDMKNKKVMHYEFLNSNGASIPSLIGQSPYEVRKVSGIDVVVIDAEKKFINSNAGIPIFSVLQGGIYTGNLRPAQTSWLENRPVFFNKIAINHLISASGKPSSALIQ